MRADNDNTGLDAGSGLLVQLNDFLGALSSLCDRLENLADGLPKAIDRQEFLSVARGLGPLVRRAHVFEEEAVFPYLREQADKNSALLDSLNRLQFEHWEDETFADELCEEMLASATGHDNAKIEKLSYMLRGFFEGLRRHIAFEKEHIAPLLAEPTHA